VHPEANDINSYVNNSTKKKPARIRHWGMGAESPDVALVEVPR
jgi:hypothetical protein